MPARLAIVGSGIAGLTAAYYASKLTQWTITVYEAGSRLGGHAHSHTLEDDAGNDFTVDTGFIVFNDRNYPNFRAILKDLDVVSTHTEMSFSVSLPKERRRGSFEYNGGSMGGLFAQRSNLVNGRFWNMLREILRFNRLAKAAHRQANMLDESIGSWLDKNGFSEDMVVRYLLPMAAAVWSASTHRIRDFPVRSLFHFLDNHGLLDIQDRPQWFSLLGGSQSYVAALSASSGAQFLTHTAVARILTDDEGVKVCLADGRVDAFDAVLIACHADEALALLDQPDQTETSILGAFSYSDNQVFLHSDAAWMPVRFGAWASWNYTRQTDCETAPVSVSYWMNKLQDLNTEQLMLVTLNPDSVPRRVHREMSYRHPQFDLKARDAQQQSDKLQGHRNCWYAGAHWRWGFHEDGVVSALWALRSMGVPVTVLDEMEAK